MFDSFLYDQKSFDERYSFPLFLFLSEGLHLLENNIKNIKRVQNDGVNLTEYHEQHNEVQYVIYANETTIMTGELISRLSSPSVWKATLLTRTRKTNLLSK